MTSLGHIFQHVIGKKGRTFFDSINAVNSWPS